MSHRKDPGNTKHVRDGHRFVEMYGNCKKKKVSNTPFQDYAILGVDFCELYRFGLTRARAPQKVFFLISMEWSAEKGIRRSGSQVPVNTFVSPAAVTSLPCMFPLTLHVNLHCFACLFADFSPVLLLFHEAAF